MDRRRQLLASGRSRLTSRFAFQHARIFDTRATLVGVLWWTPAHSITNNNVSTRYSWNNLASSYRSTYMYSPSSTASRAHSADERRRRRWEGTRFAPEILARRTRGLGVKREDDAGDAAVPTLVDGARLFRLSCPEPTCEADGEPRK